MSHSKGPWIYDAESGAVYTKDRTGYWGPDHYPVEVCAVAPLDGVNNGPLLAAALELLEIVKEAIDYGLMRYGLEDKAIRIVAKAEGRE